MRVERYFWAMRIESAGALSFGRALIAAIAHLVEYSDDDVSAVPVDLGEVAEEVEEEVKASKHERDDGRLGAEERDGRYEEHGRFYDEVRELAPGPNIVELDQVVPQAGGARD